jgi:hypothetical protein
MVAEKRSHAETGWEGSLAFPKLPEGQIKYARCLRLAGP